MSQNLTNSCITEIIDSEIERFVLWSPETFRPLVSYVLKSNGKKLRPRIAITLLCELVNENVNEDLLIKSILPSAIALEIFHTASLIHDDLPSLDNDDMRRGKPTLHKAFSEPHALLTGDALISLAIEYVIKFSVSMNHDILLESIGRLSKAYSQVCEGQVLDTSDNYPQKDLFKIHKLKTAPLFRESFALPEIFLNEKDVIFAEKMGESYGLAFQLIDDLIDLIGTDFDRGRKGSSDQRNIKTTHAQLSLNDGIEIAQRAVSEFQANLNQYEAAKRIKLDQVRNLANSALIRSEAIADFIKINY